ncbi:MAG: class I SAM-dependent methyltransferase, partial [Nitrososphaerales archaeon]|nr:class I SAM-dependent methyltransferase [Nitrososphaerales archaeon]
ADIGYIPDAVTDVVLAKGLICCMLDHEGALREIRRILKPGGRVFFSVTKFGGKKDRRRVDKGEWESILSRFVVKSRGEGLTNRWAWALKSSSG